LPKLNLQPRDRRMLTIGVIALVLWGAYLGAQGPLKKYQLSAKNVVEARNRIKTLRTVEATVASERRGQEAFKKLVDSRRRGFDLFVYLQELSRADLPGRVDLKNSVVTSGGGIAEVVVTMNGVSIEQFVDFLHKVYSSNNLIAVPRVDYVRLARDQKGLDCRLAFISPRA